MRRGGAFLHSGSPLRCRLNFSILGLGDMKLAGPREVRTSKARLPGFGTLWAAGCVFREFFVLRILLLFFLILDPVVV